jgi:excisionase family DNA binding protein
VEAGTTSRHPSGMTHTSARLLLRPEAVADALDVSRARVFELLRDGTLKSIKIGRSRRVPVEELERFIAARMEQSA